MRKFLTALLSLLLLAAVHPGRTPVGLIGSVSGGGGPAAPTHTQVILQGTTAPNNAAMFICTSATPQCPGYAAAFTLYFGSGQTTNLDEVGWKSVASATNYQIFRSTNGGAFTSIATITAATASSNYTSYVSNQGSNPVVGNIDSAYTDNTATNVVSGSQYPPVNLTGSVTSGSNVFTVTNVNNNVFNATPGAVIAGQGISGPGIPSSTIINAFGSGSTTGSGSTGTYQLSQNASANGSGTYGTQYFSNTSYIYYVEAEVGGVWSSPSADAILPYIVNGQYILAGGNFGTGTAPGTAPATTPLGYSNDLQWTATSSNSVMGLYAGNSAADQALNVNGYNYLNVAFYTASSGVNFDVQTEVPGDNVILSLTPLSNFGFGNLTPNTWNTYKIPVSDIYIDNAWAGSAVIQNSWYKVIFQYDYGTVGSTTIHTEMWLSVN